MELKLEVIVIPVSDADRARDFYQALGWRLDADFPATKGYRIIQVTPGVTHIGHLRRRCHDGRAGVRTPARALTAKTPPPQQGEKDHEH